MNAIVEFNVPKTNQWVAAPDAFELARLLSDACPDRAYAFALMMEEKTACDIDGRWHEHWLNVMDYLRKEKYIDGVLSAPHQTHGPSSPLPA